MPYKILTVADSEQFVIQSADDAHDQLLLADLRDLLLLRNRIDRYLSELSADGEIDRAPTAPGEMIQTAQARAEAAAQGHVIEESTLRIAITRGNIPGAEKRGGRWWIPRAAFEDWLEGHLQRK